MQVTICAPGEIDKKIFMNRKGVLVLARCGQRVVLLRDGKSDLWTVPLGVRRKDEDPEEAAHRVVCEALGCADVDVYHLCDYVCKGKKRRAVGGRAYLAAIYGWEPEGRVSLLDGMPAAGELLEPELMLGVYQWAGDFFDEALEVDRLCWPLPRNRA